MKKAVVSIFLFCMLISQAIGGFATAQQIIIDGAVVDIPEDMGSIREKDDRTFVPIRFISEYLGCAVNYGALQESATITDANSVSYLAQRDSEMLYILPNTGMAQRIRMDTQVFVDDSEDRMYIPIRFFAQALGYTVDWDEATQTVTLTTAPPTE
ncbi:copper amine oxidase N-terminal domain-containing protein [Oscillospiraceae bacterium DSM 107454]|uniref:Copper amine oxidase N-terminal domain-containing protein n=2 Tax=Ructibacterium gallinarum TaxID=2779355 RepID=A0A9D5M4R4_9FIRM|nr:copper amine oxidase N-terminal domain-containing protein [Ructibacterium gallinarum]